MIGVYIAAGVMAGCVLMYLFLIKPRSPRRRPDTAPFLHRLYAHRGLHTAAVPENSLAAFRAAADRGLGIELDVQLSKDGQVVVCHDFDLNRVAGLDRKVAELTVDELRQVSLRGTDQYVPTLKEVLDAVGGRVPLIVEIKIPGMDLAVCPKLFELLDAYSGAYCVESFHPLALYWVRRNRPGVLRGQLSMDFFAQKMPGSRFQFFVIKNLLLNVLARPDFIAFDYRNADAFSFTVCRKLFRALPVAWTVRTEEARKQNEALFPMQICEDIFEDRESLEQ